MMRKRSLLFKLTASAFLVIGVLGLLWIGAGWYFSSAANRAAGVRDLADQIFIDMLQLRRAEKNLLLRDLQSAEFYEGQGFTTPSLNNHQERVSALQTHVEDLKTLLPEEKQTMRVDLTKAVNDYNGSFSVLVAAYRKRGFEDWGFEGQWRKSAGEIKTVLTESGNAKLLTIFRELRLQEKDYLLRGDQKYVDLVDEQLKDLRESLPVELPEKSTEILNHLNEYATAFKGHQTQMTTIGLTEDDGLRKHLADAVDAMEPLLIDPQTGIRPYADNTEQRARRNLLASQIVILVIGVGGAGILFYWLGRLLTAPLAIMVQSADAVAQGDLTQPALAEGGDETGRMAAAFNRMTKSLKDLLAQNQQLTEQLATATQEINTASQQQVASMTETASSLNEISSTAEEFKTTTQEFADRARAVQEAAEETSKQARDGRTLAQQSTVQTEAVRDDAHAAGEMVLQFTDRMQRVTNITDTVNEIAEQTKLLALNASIEAARAGEEGKGFAVVAIQIRELANQSKTAAGNIASLISDTQRSLKSVVDRIEQGSRKSDETATMVRSMADRFEHVVGAFGETADAMTQMAGAAQQQEEGIAALVTGLTQIESATRETVASAEQTQKSIAGIDKQIETLKEAMAKFEV